MPATLARTPEWLSRPNPGYNIFMESELQASAGYSATAANSSRKRAAKPGPRRTIARRGTEIFIAVGKEIRWADLVYLKEAWEETSSKPRGKKQSKDSQYTEDHAQGYRVSFRFAYGANRTLTSIPDHQNSCC
jgi:nucleoporin NUP82